MVLAVLVPLQQPHFAEVPFSLSYLCEFTGLDVLMQFSAVFM